MSSKTQTEIYNIVVGLESKPSNLRICNAYIDQFLMNWSYETEDVAAHATTQNQLSALLTKFRAIRGR